MVCCVWFLASGVGECCCDAAPAPKGELCTSHRPGCRAPLLLLPLADPGPFTGAGLPGSSAPPARGGEAGVGRGGDQGPAARGRARGLPPCAGGCPRSAASSGAAPRGGRSGSWRPAGPSRRLRAAGAAR